MHIFVFFILLFKTYNNNHKTHLNYYSIINAFGGLIRRPDRVRTDASKEIFQQQTLLC